MTTNRFLEPQLVTSLVASVEKEEELINELLRKAYALDKDGVLETAVQLGKLRGALPDMKTDTCVAAS